MTSSTLDIEGAVRQTLTIMTRNLVPISVLALVIVGLPSLVLEGNLFSESVVKRGVWTSFGLSGAVLTLAQALLQAAIVRLVWRDLAGEPALPLGQSLREATNGVWSILLLALTIGAAKAIWFLLMIPGFLALIVPGLILLGIGLYVLVSWSVAVPAAVIEDLGAWAAMQRSATLTKGDRWPIFGTIVLLLIAGIILSALFGAVADSFGKLLADALLAAITSVLLVVLYGQLKQARSG
jgi:Membrane domain of glycerophosphoryl diester phosphodiesterase